MKLSYWEKLAQESPDAADRIDSLRSQGVKFNICANTLKGRKIALDDLHFAEEGDIVPSGVAEIGKLQQDGFIYLRPLKVIICLSNARLHKAVGIFVP